MIIREIICLYMCVDILVSTSFGVFTYFRTVYQLYSAQIVISTFLYSGCVDSSIFYTLIQWFSTFYF